MGPGAHAGARRGRWPIIRRVGCRANGDMSARTLAPGSGLAAASGTETAHVGDNPNARSRNGTGADTQPHSGPDVDTTGRRNGRDSSPFRLEEPLNPPPTLEFARNSLSLCHWRPGPASGCSIAIWSGRRLSLRNEGGPGERGCRNAWLRENESIHEESLLGRDARDSRESSVAPHPSPDDPASATAQDQARHGRACRESNPVSARCELVALASRDPACHAGRLWGLSWPDGLLN